VRVTTKGDALHAAAGGQYERETPVQPPGSRSVRPRARRPGLRRSRPRRSCVRAGDDGGLVRREQLPQPGAVPPVPLTGGARLVAGNESFSVNSSSDRSSLSLPAGSSATSPATCITLLHPTLRFFALNSGAPTSVLTVDAIVKLAGIRVSLPVGLLLGGSSWQPTLPLPFLTNLLAPLSGTVSFRFAPLGPGGGWRIDDVYLDPYKSA
jgi:hypothetical protein